MKRMYFPPQGHRGASGVTLSQAIDGFTLACRARKLSEHTLTDYGRTLRRFLAHVGDLRMTEIGTTQISAFLASQKNVREKTLLNYHIGLAALWTWAIREEHVTRHVVRIVAKPRAQKTIVEPLTQVEILRLLDVAKAGRLSERNRSVILLLLDTGIRASELCGVKLADIDFQRRLIKVLGKGNKERLLPFSRRTGQAIFDYMFPLADVERLYPFTRTSLAHLIATLGRRAGVRGAHPHRFRHTFAVNFLRNGGDPYTLQEILGHSTLDTVKLYLAIAQIDIEEAHLRASPVENWKL